ncbi:hypothetical protein [Nocardia altamirensis]|uniref:hypothetical protein n=1 Tax=Nocardia altamirensis TaxID=472158 RepID=UPI0008407A29|nr:hypothetical protein [Nocardia altamirensis]
MDPAPQYHIDPAGLPGDTAQRLFEAWVLDLSRARFDNPQWGTNGDSEGRTVTVGAPEGDHFVLRWSGLDISIMASNGIESDTVQSILESALARVAAQDLGTPVIYSVEMKLTELDFGSGAAHFMRLLGDQVHIEGSCRLGDEILLDFEEGLLSNTPLLLAPPSKVRVTIFAPGPGPSEWSQRNAAGCAEVVAAICAFATGRPVDYQVPQFPAKDVYVERAVARRHSPEILGLARDSVSLNVFGDLFVLGGLDAALRVRGALLAYHAALKQTTPDVAVMLFVTAIEALIAPRPEWGKDKVTTRFKKSLIDLCPYAVDALLAHDNVEQAFEYRRRGGVNRQRQDLVDRIYEMRSTPTHTGLALSASGMAILGTPSSMRVALLSDLARAAVLSFIRAPRSSVIGHPMFDQSTDCQMKYKRLPMLTTVVDPRSAAGQYVFPIPRS